MMEKDGHFATHSCPLMRSVVRPLPSRYSMMRDSTPIFTMR